MKLRRLYSVYNEGITWGPGDSDLSDIEFFIDPSVELPAAVADALQGKPHIKYDLNKNFKPGMSHYKKPSSNQVLVTANPRTADRARQDDKPVIYHTASNLANTLRMIERPTSNMKYSIDLDDTGLALHPEGPYPKIAGSQKSSLDHELPSFGSASSATGELVPTPDMANIMRYLARPEAQNALSIKNFTVPEINKKVKVVSVLPSSEEFKYILSALKASADTSNIELLYQLMALFCVSYYRRSVKEPVRMVVCPQSSSPWAKEVAARVADELGCPEPVIYKKNKDPDTITVNQSGVLSASKTWLKNGTPVKDPITNQNLPATPANVEKCWHNWGVMFAKGQKKLKDMDLFVRRNNLFGLYVAPEMPPMSYFTDASKTKQKGVSVGKHVLIVDDIATFGMTVTNIAYDLYGKGAGLVSGFTYYASK